MERISRETMLMQIARVVAQRGTCERKQVGAVFSRGGRPLVTGFNGSPSGKPHCLDEGCILGPNGGCIRCNHAETNAMTWAAREGIALLDATLHVTVSPCEVCANLLLNLGLRNIVYLEEYRKSDGLIILRDAGIIVEQFEEI